MKSRDLSWVGPIFSPGSNTGLLCGLGQVIFIVTCEMEFIAAVVHFTRCISLFVLQIVSECLLWTRHWECSRNKANKSKSSPHDSRVLLGKMGKKPGTQVKEGYRELVIENYWGVEWRCYFWQLSWEFYSASESWVPGGGSRTVCTSPGSSVDELTSALRQQGR